MSAIRLLTILAATALAAASALAAAGPGPAPVYTGEDLDRMFGTPPTRPSDPVDKSGPEDWRWVEQFLDREYARIDADRRHELERAEMDARTQDIDRAAPFPATMRWRRSGIWGVAVWPFPTSRCGVRDGPAAPTTGAGHRRPPK